MPDARPKTETPEFAAKAEAAAREERRIQAGIDAEEKSFKGETGSDKDSKPPRTGARDYPAPPLPKQHLKKPGLEADLKLQPMCDAPHYKGSGKLKDMAALITGGDSGIGRAVAVLYAREGADVAIAYVSEHEDAEETKRLVEAEGRRAILLPGDVADPAYCKAAVEKTVAAFGKLDILVNNAAFQEHARSIEDITDEHFLRTLHTNLGGCFFMARAAVPHMKEGASIVMTGSVTALEGSKKLLDYSMTKGGIHTFARSLANNLIEKGIRVNVVAPGPVWTPLNPADSPPDKVAEFGKNTDMKRPAQPEEIAPAFVFLASPQTASYITGEVLPIIGGYGA
jgi:NAD(P)-dependent dehydrogenase (short-subunit alcohol dehydrogenase family)